MCVCHHPFVWRVFLMLCFPFSLDICQQSRKSCFIFENNCGKVLVVSEKCVPLHPLSPFRGRQPSKRDHWKDYIHRQVVQEKRGCLFGALGYKWTSVAALPRTLYYICIVVRERWYSGRVTRPFTFFIILCFLSLSFGERYSVDLEAYWDRQRSAVRSRSPFLGLCPAVSWQDTVFYNVEFDPGSGWTLATGLTHASRGASWR